MAEHVVDLRAVGDRGQFEAWCQACGRVADAAPEAEAQDSADRHLQMVQQTSQQGAGDSNLELLVIVPSRGRPHNIAVLHDAWQDTALGSAELLVAVDDDDPTLGSYQELCTERGLLLRVGPRLRLGGTLNELAVTHASIYFALGFMGDDHRPSTLGWDERFVTELKGLGTGMVYGDDGLQGEAIPTAIAMTSDIVQTLGWMSPPGLVHLNIDIAWTALGRAIDRYRYLPDVKITHMHPSAGLAEMDAGYREVNSQQQVTTDDAAYHRWHTEDLPNDIAKLKTLL